MQMANASDLMPQARPTRMHIVDYGVDTDASEMSQVFISAPTSTQTDQVYVMEVNRAADAPSVRDPLALTPSASVLLPRIVLKDSSILFMMFRCDCLNRTLLNRDPS